MRFCVRKGGSDNWLLSPQSGLFSGIVVAEADCVSLRSVEVFCRILIGEVRATWGVCLTTESVIDDNETRQGLRLNMPFNTSNFQLIHLDYDGFLDSSRRKIVCAQKALLMHHRVYMSEVQINNESTNQYW
jgi:hypothetical protein